MDIIKRALAFVYGIVTELRGWLFDIGVLDQIKLPVPVVSVGNLTVGGTGKTPVIRLLAERFQRSGKTVGIISRNYRAQVRGFAEVDLTRPQAGLYFGDEPTLLAATCPGVRVFVGPRKWETAKRAIELGKFDVILVDDGFQHRRLYRDLDLVLLDVTKSKDIYQIFPWGEARESFAGLRRATTVVLTKVNLADELQLQSLRQILPAGTPTVELTYQLQDLTSLQGRSLLAVAGIAQPESFRALLREEGFLPARFLTFADHHPYSQQDVHDILENMRSSGAEVLVTTEKDFVKLRDFSELQPILFPVALQNRIRLGQEFFDATLSKFCN